jgi:tetratricopeptide (TPR) repeat protein
LINSCARLEKYQQTDNPFKQLQMGEVRDDNLETALALSYEPLNDEQQTAFRRMGVLPSGLSMDIALAYALWQDAVEDCDDEDDAEDLLDELVGLGLATLRDDGRYQQHQNLQAYARALLLRDGELEDAQVAYDAYVLDFLRQASDSAESKSSFRQAIAPHLAHVQQYGNRLIHSTQAWLTAHKAGNLADYAQPIAQDLPSPADDELKRILGQVLALMDAGARRYIFDLRLDDMGEAWLCAGVWASRSLGTPLQQYELLRRLNSWYTRHGQRTQDHAYLQAQYRLANAMQDYELIANSLSQLASWHIREHRIADDSMAQVRVILARALANLPNMPDDDPHRHTDPFGSQRRARLLRLLGRACFQDKDYDEALTHYEQALAQERADGNRSGEAILLQEQARCWRMLRRNDLAESMMHDALAIQRELGEREHIANTLMQLGVQYRAQKHLKRALDAYHEALALRRNSDDHEQIASLYRNLGFIYKEMRRFDDAHDAYQNALASYDRAGDRLQRMYALRNYASLLVMMKDVQQALPYFEEVITYFRDLGDMMQVGSTQRSLAAAYQETNLFDEAIAAYHATLATYQQADNPVQIGHTFRTLGDIHVRIKDTDEALTYYAQAREGYARADDGNNIGFTFRKEADIHLRRKDYERTESAYRSAIEAYTQADEGNRAGQVWHDLGELLRDKRRQPAESIPCYAEALALRDEHDPHGRGLSYERIADASFRLKDDANVLPNLENAFTCYVQARSMRAANVCLRNLRKAYKRTQQEDAVITLFENTLPHAEGDDEAHRYLQQLIASEYSKRDDHDRAIAIYTSLLDGAPIDDSQPSYGGKHSHIMHQGQLLSHIHEIHRAQNRPADTYPMYEALIADYAKRDDTYSQARLWHWLGRIQKDDGDTAEAIQSWLNALHHMHDDANMGAERRRKRGFNAYAIRADLQRAYREVSDFEGLWRLYEAQLAQEEGDAKVPARIRTLREMGAWAIEMNEAQRAIPVLREAITLYETHQPNFMRFSLEELREMLAGAEG